MCAWREDDQHTALLRRFQSVSNLSWSAPPQIKLHDPHGDSWMDSLNRFKSRLNTYLFMNAYSLWFQDPVFILCELLSSILLFLSCFGHCRLVLWNALQKNIFNIIVIIILGLYWTFWPFHKHPILTTSRCFVIK